MNNVTCLADVHAVLGEGPLWVPPENALYWLDIKGKKVFRLDEGGMLKQWDTPLRVGSIATRESGGFIAGTEEGIAEIDLDAGRFSVVIRPEAHLPDNRFNDGKVDRRGNFWAGSMDDLEQANVGTLYRIAPDRSCMAVDRDYAVTNGPAFSPDGSIMYHSDSGSLRTYAFDLDEVGSASNRRIFMQFEQGHGYPDGMTVDAEGCLWIAFWDGWCVRRYSPNADLLHTVDMPVARPTSCAFGGPDLDQLYITSASFGLDESALAVQPNAGGLFMVRTGVQGIAERSFAG